jgi:hypothetical protein
VLDSCLIILMSKGVVDVVRASRWDKRALAWTEVCECGEKLL